MKRGLLSRFPGKLNIEESMLTTVGGKKLILRLYNNLYIKHLIIEAYIN